MNLYFDLDGTLLDVRARYRALHRQTIAAVGGRPLPFRLYWRLKRQATPESEIGRRCGLDVRATEQYRRLRGDAIERAELLALDAPVPGALEALDALAGRGDRCLIVTSRRDESALSQQLGGLGLRQRALAVLRAPCDRPAEGKAALIAADLAAHPAATLVVGDTAADVLAAAAVGVPCCAVLTGLRSRRLLAAARPAHILASVSGLSRLLDRYADRAVPAWGERAWRYAHD